MDFSRLEPAMCKCSRKPLPELVAAWSARTQERVKQVMLSGKRLNFDALKKEAQMLASLGRGGPAAFAEQHAHYGHFCDECPYRAHTPFRETLVVDRPES